MENTVRLIEEDLAAVYLGNLNTVEQTLAFPAAGKNGSAFTWESSEERFIDKEGRVHRPLFGMGDRPVRLTVTAVLNGVSRTRVFEATVLQEKKDTVITGIRPLLKVTAAADPELPHYTAAETEDGRLMAVPVTWVPMPEEWAAASAGTGEQFMVGEAEGTDIPAMLCLQKTERRAGTILPAAVSYPAPGTVRLTAGSCYYDAAQVMGEWLLAQDTDQMLYNFRQAAGLDTRGAAPMTGWDDPAGHLRGHTTGHYLSGLSLAFSVTGDVRFREKAAALVDGLAECQQAFAAGGRVKPGFLSAYDETQFDLLEVYTPYPQIWAPYYTLDKIMSGLYDAYIYTGNETALAVESAMGDWVYNRLSRLDGEKRRKMWSMYIAGEYGGMLGTMVQLYGLTGKDTHLECASFFLNPKLFDPMEAGLDTLEDMHGNQHIPQIIGALAFYDALCGIDPGRCENERLARLADDREKYFLIVMNFIEITGKGQLYVNGGVGETAMFHRAGSAKRLFTDKTAESCATYNLERLYAGFFAHASSAKVMDRYENSLLNHILMSASPRPDGGTTYFMPLRPGGRKEYSTEENTCCHGTGMESRFRYVQHIFALDAEALYLNLYIPSELQEKEAGANVRLCETEEGTFSLQFRADWNRKVRIRIPGWTSGKIRVLVNGAETAFTPEKGYAVLAGGFSAGDEICIVLPYGIRRVSAGFGKVSFLYGPYMLAALSESADWMKAPDPSSIRKTGKETFSAGTIKMLPAYRVDGDAYHMIMEA